MSRRLPTRHAQWKDSVSEADARIDRLARAGSAYTLVHAGRQLRLGPLAFWVGVGTLAVMAAWTITTATYFAFRDDVLTRLIARQAEMQFGYEDRIAELRAQIDRTSSRQLLDQEQYEQKLEQIIRRQTALESRASALSGLGEVTGSVRQPAARSGGSGEPRQAKPSPVGDKGTLLRLPDAASRLLRGFATAKPGGLGGTLARLQASLDRIEQHQVAALASIERSYETKAVRMRGVLAELGVDVGKAASADRATGMGGPFVPARLGSDGTNFEQQFQRISLARSQISRLTRALSTVPVRRPLHNVLDPVSPFGVRADPFTGTPAMHTGLDLHGETGDPVRATADGTVTAAGWSGGYGRVVDVDHGNGLATRYGHLSSIEVRVGESVKIGQLLGRVGSTGRSSGPHLHYETRVKGEPVDPNRFLRAGQRLDPTL
jgi:murein DD-endopeptidase MepM/ murein hydrolase activator NlpD